MYTLNLPHGFQPIPLPYRDAWISLLRSEEYPQGRGALQVKLRSGPFKLGYCCLGVLSVVQGRLTPDGYDTQDEKTGVALKSDNPCFPVIGSCGRLPDGVTVTVKGCDCGSLSSLNDGPRLSFREIAEILEKVYTDAPIAL